MSGHSYPASAPTSMTQTSNQNADIITASTQYDDYGNALQATDVKGLTTTYTYDATKKWLLSERTPADAGTYLYKAYTRNTQGTITGLTVRKNDAAGEILQQISYSGIDVYGNVTTQQIANGTKTVLTTTNYGSDYAYAYPTRQSVMVKDADGVASTIAVQMEYNLATGLPSVFIDGKTNRTAYKYDKLGRIKEVTYPGDITMSVAYDDNDNTLTVTDELGNRTQTRFNSLGWMEESGQFEEAGYAWKTRTTYDTYGRVTETEGVGGNRTLMEYDSWSRPVKTTVGDAITSVKYNDVQRKVTTTDALGYSQIATSDRYGQVMTIEEQPTGRPLRQLTEYKYHPYNGHVTQLTDAKDGTTSMSYDLLGQLTAVTNAKQETTNYEYDKLGNLTKTTYPDGEVRTKEYDELGRLIRATDPLLKQDRYYYDANGNRIKLIDKVGQVFQYTYTNRNFLLTKKGPSETIAYTYLANGARKTMSDGTGLTQYTYKPYTAELEWVIYPDGKQIGYTYEANGQRSTMTTPFADTVDYKYTNQRQLESVSWNGTKQAFYTYEGNGQLQSQTQAGGLQTEYEYTDKKLTNLKLKLPSGVVQQEYGYTHDANRNITTLTEKAGGVAKPAKAFDYDPLNRISTSTQFNESYTYDERGNRQTLTTESEVGLPTNASYAYDEWDRLTKVTPANGLSVTYRYNGDNLLVERQENGVKTRYYYDGQDIVAEGIVQTNDTVTEKVSYLRGNGLVMQESVGGQKGYYQHNGHGDVMSIRNAGGTVLNEYTYDIWGNTLTVTETVANAFRYSGEYWDETVNLQYLRARWYDPSVGRFMNEDTYEGEISDPLTLNLYTYVLNNPLLFTDPSGMCVAGKDAGCYVDSFSGVDDIIGDFHLSNNTRTWWDLQSYIKNNCRDSMCVDKYKSKQKVLELDNDRIRNNACSYVNCLEGEGKFTVTGKIQFTVNGVTNNYAVTPAGLFQCNCFTAGTTVLTDEGEKPIQDIRIGDRVLAKNDETGKVSYQEVELLFRKTVEETYNIAVNGEVITTTAEHPFWIVDKGWVIAKDLQKGERLVTNQDVKLIIQDIEVKKEHRTVYNFRVKNDHTYFVSNLNIWTHNMDSCGSLLSGTANYQVYYGYNNNKIVYVGITNDFNRRKGEHGERFEDMRVAYGGDYFTKWQARGLEQYNIDYYGMQKNGGQLQNKVNSISIYRTNIRMTTRIWAEGFIKDRK